MTRWHICDVCGETVSYALRQQDTGGLWFTVCQDCHRGVWAEKNIDVPYIMRCTYCDAPATYMSADGPCCDEHVAAQHVGD